MWEGTKVSGCELDFCREMRMWYPRISRGMPMQPSLHIPQRRCRGGEKRYGVDTTLDGIPGILLGLVSIYLTAIEASPVRSTDRQTSRSSKLL